MRIGYTVEGSTDRAFVTGLRDRWCPGLELVEGRFRGSSGQSLRREMGKIWAEFAHKSVDVAVVLTDANDQPWRDVKNATTSRVPRDCASAEFVVGVPDRYVECWLTCDASYTKRRLDRDFSTMPLEERKGAFQSGMGISTFETKEREVAEFVREAPLADWISQSESFGDFYDEVKGVGARLGCAIPNERNKS